jgi:hypothetical protein
VEMLSLFGFVGCVGFLNLIGVVAGVLRQRLALLGPTEQIPPEDRGRIQSPKLSVFNTGQDYGSCSEL